MSSGIAVGLALGFTFGLVLDNPALGIGFGLALGVAFGVSMSRKDLVDRESNNDAVNPEKPLDNSSRRY